MTYQEVLANAKKNMAPNCRVCKECSGLACRGEIPGTGGKGTGSGFIVNCEYLAGVHINMDTIYEDQGQDSSVSLFGRQFSAPVFAAPISGLENNYNGYLSEKTYAEALVAGCCDTGCAAFTGDGAPDNYLTDPLEAISRAGGVGIPTIKPWAKETVFSKMDSAVKAGAIALAMDIDAAGLPLLAAAGKPVRAKSVEELAEIRAYAPVPFVLKGIMTARSAEKAVKAGVYGIVVSNHGGRVIDGTPATTEILPEIKAAVGSQVKIFVDGGIRTGYDVFKAIALGADAVLIGRPYVIAACGGGAQGVSLYTQKVIAELKDAMKMTGCSSLQSITADKIRRSK